MPLIPMENSGKAGIIVDTPAHDLPLEAWSGGGNVVFRDGKVQKAKGQQLLYTDFSLKASYDFLGNFIPSGIVDGDYSSRVSTNAPGTLTVVGVPRKDTIDGSYAGMAYVYEMENGVPIREIELIPSDRVDHGYFGNYVKIAPDSSRIFVAQTGRNYGTVHVFEETDEHVWTEVQLIEPTFTANVAEPDAYGVMLDCNYEGTLLVVSCRQEEVNTLVHAGAAYLLDYDSVNGFTETKRIVRDSPFTNGLFASAVCISDDGKRLFISGRETISSPIGEVNVYVPTVDAYGNFTWPSSASSVLMPSDGDGGDSFGYFYDALSAGGGYTQYLCHKTLAVSTKGERLFVGTPLDNSTIVNGPYAFGDTSRDSDFTNAGSATHASASGSMRITGTDLTVGTSYVYLPVTLIYNATYVLKVQLIQGLTSNTMAAQIYNPDTSSYSTITSSPSSATQTATFSIAKTADYTRVNTHIRFGLFNGGGSDYFDIDNLDVQAEGAGSIYVFDDNGSGTYTEDENLVPLAATQTPYGYAGRSVACSENGEVLIIGNPYDNPVGDRFQGTTTIAYGALLDTMALVSTLQEESPEGLRYFGYEVDMSYDGTLVFISEYGDSVSGGPGSDGRARTHVYQIGDYELDIPPHGLLPWRTTSEIRWIYAGIADVYMTNGNTHTMITRYTSTPGDDDYTAGTRPLWTGGVLNGIPLLNHDNGTDYPQQWDSATSRLKDLVNWPANVYCKVLRVYKNFIIAMDITTSSSRNPYEIRWSSSAAAGSVPATWDYSDDTNNAGRNILSASQNTGGFIIDCLKLQDANIVYKGDSIHAMQLTATERTFVFNERSSEAGLLSPNCVKNFFGQHFVVGFNDVYLFDGFRPTSIIKNRYRRWLYNNINPDYIDKTRVIPNYKTQEMMIALVEAGSSSNYLTKALIWNWDNNTWTIKDLPDVACIENGLAAGADVTFDDLVGTFDEQDYPMGGDQITPAQTEILMGRAYNAYQLLRADTGYTDRGDNYVSWLERTGLAIAGVSQNGTPTVNPAVRKKIKHFYPKFYSDSNPVIHIYIGGQENPKGPILWEGPELFTVGIDQRVDFDVNTPYMALRMYDNGNEEWTYTGGVFDIEIVSEV